MRFPAQAPALDMKHVRALRPEHLRPTLEDGRYLHWDELRRRRPPSGLDHPQWWCATYLARRQGHATIPGFTDPRGQPFWFCRHDAIARATHELDRRDVARELLLALGDEPTREAYRIDQLLEEAISSSLIEGARITTRADAKRMIQEHRAPASHGERMVLNNYLAMEELLANVDERLTLDRLLELHAILGRDALEVEGAEGRLRRADEDVNVVDAITGEIWHTPPPAKELPKRLDALFAFANGDVEPKQFIHPLVRAMTLHFWMAYVHPFADGNGRIARALFYWQLLRAGYEAAQYLSISGPIDRHKRAYYMAFAYSETSHGDFTYFLLNQLGVLRAANDDLTNHLREHGRRMNALSRTIRESESLNHRQRAALDHLLHDAHRGLTIKAHSAQQRVTYLTARRDLQELERAGLVRRVRVGREDHYHPSDALLTRASRPRR
jgi:Fic family protein